MCDCGISWPYSLVDIYFAVKKTKALIRLHGCAGWSVACDCGISGQYSLVDIYFAVAKRRRLDGTDGQVCLQCVIVVFPGHTLL